MKIWFEGVVLAAIACLLTPGYAPATAEPVVYVPVVVSQDPPVPDPPDTTDPVASIEVVNSNGEPVVGETNVGEMLVIRSDKAIHEKDVVGSLTWIIEPPLQTFMSDGGKTVIVNTGLKPDVLRIMQIVSTKTGKNAYQRISIRIGQGPQPPPTPVDPDVDPDPVDPPVPKTGQLKVLIVEETGSRGELPSSQISVFTSMDIRDYVKKACSKTGEQPDFRVYDKDVSVATEPEWIKKAFSEQRQGLPWILISNGTTGFSGPLPKDVTETLSLLKKYGGE